MHSSSAMENYAEEFGVLDVLARYRSPFTVLMDPEERLARENEENFELNYELDDEEGAAEDADSQSVEDEESITEDKENIPGDREDFTGDKESITKDKGNIIDDKENIAINSINNMTNSIINDNTKDNSTSDNNKSFLVENNSCTTADDTVLHKYYQQRYDYFSRFDEGIQIDHEGWYSVTPESIAAHTAQELFAIAAAAAADDDEESVVVDAFCGVGGNAIQFASVFDRVIAVDLSASRLELARHNASVYGVADRIEFVWADAFEFLAELGRKKRKISAVFLSPPWGGPEYCSKATFHPRLDLFEGRGLELLRLARSLTKHCVFFMPRQTDIYAFAQMIQEADGVDEVVESDSFVVEQHFLRRRLKAISFYLY